MLAIEVRGLSESYWPRSGGRTIKAAIASMGRSLGGRRWALEDVDLDVEAGSMMGLIGANGSGKTTLLRCIGGIFRPSKGTVTVRGRTASLIDLTAGFHVDLSARDNVLLSGAIYGIPRVDLIERLDEIFSFAELESEIDSPLRSFSTGMGMRLGFSLAVALDPDVLLVDEVLAVGDESFKQRCLERVATMRSAGATIVFASHELSLIRSLCDRVAVLDGGRVSFEGNSHEAVELYCERLGVDIHDALDNPPLEASVLRRVEREWSRRR